MWRLPHHRRKNTWCEAGSTSSVIRMKPEEQSHASLLCSGWGRCHSGSTLVTPPFSCCSVQACCLHVILQFSKQFTETKIMECAGGGKAQRMLEYLNSIPHVLRGRAGSSRWSSEEGHSAVVCVCVCASVHVQDARTYLITSQFTSLFKIICVA